MPHRTTSRLVLLALLAASILPGLTSAQSQDSESVAEAARRARENKKTPPKPAKSFTEDDLKPAPPTGPLATQDSSATPDGSVPPSPAKEGKEPKESKDAKARELAALKEQVKQAQDDYDLFQRARALQEDSYYSNPNYARDTQGKTKLDTLIQQANDKKQALDALKAKLETMLKALPDSANSQTPQP